MSYHSFLGKIGYVYILSNKRRNVLYIGVTKDLNTRIYQHKMGEGSKFAKKYKIKDLIYFEKYPNINQAIQREKQFKKPASGLENESYTEDESQSERSMGRDSIKSHVILNLFQDLLKLGNANTNW